MTVIQPEPIHSNQPPADQALNSGAITPAGSQNAGTLGSPPEMLDYHKASGAAGFNSALKAYRRRNYLKAVLLMLGVAFIIGGSVWAYGQLASRLAQDPQPPIVSQTYNNYFDDSAHDKLPPSSEVLTINRDLRVKGTATLSSLVVLDQAELRGNLTVIGDGTFGGNVTAANFYGNGSGLTGIRASNCTTCVALQGTPTTAQTGNIHLDGDVTATNFRGRFFGDGSGLTNLPGLTGTFVALQDVSPGTQQGGHLNISGNGIFGTNLTAGGSLTVTGATVLNNSLSISGTTTLADLISSGQIKLTGNTADRLLLQPVSDPSSPTKLFTIKNAAGTEQASLTSDGTLNLAGNAAIGGNGSINGSLTVSGTSALQGNTTVVGTLAVTGAGSFGGDLTVATINTRPVGNASGDIPVSNGTVNVNLNADLLDGLDSSAFQAAGSYFAQGGNSFGAIASLGTNDAFDLQLETGGTPKLTIQNSTGNVGIGTTGPGAKLQVNTVAAGTIGQIIQGAASQTADLQQWQNSAGTVLSAVAPSGLLNLSAVGATVNATGTATGDKLALWGNTFGIGVQAARVVVYTPGNNGLGIRTAASSGQASSGVEGITLFANGQATFILGLNATGNYASSFGGAGVAAQILTVSTAVGTNVGLVVKGTAGQTADLQQWQDSAGATLAKVNSAGDISAHGFILTGNGGASSLPALQGAGGQRIFSTTAGGWGIGNSTGGTAAVFSNGVYTAGFGTGGNIVQVERGTNSLFISPVASATRYIRFDSGTNTELGFIDNNLGQSYSLQNASTIGLQIKGAASQTADLQQWQNSAGGVTAKIDASSNIWAGNRVYIARSDQAGLTTALSGYMWYDTTNALNIFNHLNAPATIVVSRVGDNSGNSGWKFASGSIQTTGVQQVVIGTGAGFGTQSTLYVQSANSSQPVGVFRGAASQAADLLQLQDSAGLINASFNSTGNQLTLGRIASSGTVTQGKLLFSDGTTDNFSGTLQTTTLTANRTYTLPDSTGTFCLDTQNCSGSGTGYILNGTTIQTGANFAIQSAAAASVGGVIRGAASQTADLQQWQNSSSTVIAKVDSGGKLTATSLAVESSSNADLYIQSNGGFFNRLNFNNSTGSPRTMLRENATSLDLVNAFGAVQTWLPNGNVGIGTASPSGKLHVQGTNDAVNTALFAAGADTVAAGTPSMTLQVKGGAGQTADLLQWQNSAGTILARVDASGNGFFSNGGGSSGAAYVQGGNSFGAIASLGTNDAFDLQLETGGTPKLTIQNSTGNVGIGNTAPGNKLSINALTTADNLAQVAIATNATTNKGLVIQGAAAQTADLQQWQNSAGTALASVTSSGNIMFDGNREVVIQNAAAGNPYPNVPNRITLQSQYSGAVRLAQGINPSTNYVDFNGVGFMFGTNMPSGVVMDMPAAGGNGQNYVRINGTEQYMVFGSTIFRARGDTRQNVKLNGGFGYSGENGVGAPSLSLDSTGTATSGTPVFNSYIQQLRGSYWTGSAAADVAAGLGVDATSKAYQIVMNDLGTDVNLTTGATRYLFDTTGNLTFKRTGANAAVGAGIQVIDATNNPPLKMNSTAGTSTGGVEVWSGGASPTLSAKFQGLAASPVLQLRGKSGQTGDLLQAQDSTGAVLARIDAAGNLTVKNATVQGTLTVSGHIVTGNPSGTTTIAAGAVACTTPTVTIDGNDTAGTITVTTGTGCAGTGALATVTFATAYGAAPRIVLTPRNAGGSTLQYYNGSSTTTTFTLDTNTTPADSTTYTYNYQALQ